MSVDWDRLEGAGRRPKQVARMSAAICGINASENPRMSLRSSGLRLLHDALPGSRYVELAGAGHTSARNPVFVNSPTRCATSRQRRLQ
jgi:hypothetical protein